MKYRLLRHHEAWLLAMTLLFILFTLQGCFLFGIHTQVHNPRHARKYPEFSESLKLLGKQDTKYRNCFDVTFYNLSVQVYPEEKYLKGSVEILAVSTSAMDTLQIDLFENMKVNSIGIRTMMSFRETATKFNPTPFFRKHGAIFIPYKQNSNQIFSIRIEYEGSPVVAQKPPWKGGFVWEKDKEGNPWIGVACETEGASLWWPCKDVTNDEPDSARINITVPKELVGVANGHLIGKSDNVDIKHATYQWHVSYPINLYDISIYAGKFRLLEDSHTMPSGKTLSINHYVLPVNYEKAKKHLAQAKDQLAFFEKTFGEYPWYKDGYKLIESPYEGMEHQTAIAYGAGYKTGYQGFDYIVLHESAHEWWGNSITASDLSDVWLQEGFATYSEALFVEETQGANAYLRYLLTYRLFIRNRRPVVGPRDARFFDYKDSDVYMKGAWILHTLRTLIKDDNMFFGILKNYYEAYSRSTIASADFIKTVNEKTGEDYQWFFNQYLYKRHAPVLEYYTDGTDLFYRWAHTDSAFRMPAEIALDGLVMINLKPGPYVQKLPVSGNTYKEITFNNYTELFGVRKNKKLRREYLRQGNSNF